MTVKILEMQGPEITLDGASARVIYWVTTAQEVDTFLQASLGAQGFPSAGGFTYSRRLSHPQFPWLWLSKVAVSPFFRESPPGDAETFLYGDGYRLDAEFVGRCFNRPADPRCPTPNDKRYEQSFVTMESRGGGSLFSIPCCTLRWEHPLTDTEDDVVPPDIESTMFIPEGWHEVSWTRVTSPPWDSILATVGRVNEHAFPAGASVKFEAETMLLESYEASVTYDDNAGSTFSIHYKFVERRNWDEVSESWCGWNHYPRLNARFGEPMWQRIMRRTAVGFGSVNTLFMYDPVDFEKLFTQD